jgi:trigger factor
MSYKVTFKKLPGSEVEFTGEIESSVFDSYRSHAIGHLGENLEVPGFRKGKAPESVIAKNVPEMAILEEMANHAIMEAYPKMLKEHNVNPLGSPAVQITKIASGNPLAFTLRTAVVPDIELPDYKAIAKKESADVKVEVTDKEFEEALERVKKMRAEGIAENKERQEKESGEAPTEAKEAEEKKEELLPELTDEYVKSLGAFENVEDFKKKFRENMQMEKENREHEKNRLNIMEKILEAAKGEMPNILIEGELDRMTYRMKLDIQRMGISYDDYMKHLGKSEEAMRNELRADAEKRVKMEIMISDIAVKENITPNEEEVQKEVDRLVKEYPGTDPARAKAYVEQVLVNEQVFKMLESQKK